MQQYYTLEEAARVLHTTPDKLKEMAKRNEVRAFQDRGTWRFRTKEIDEKAREQGYGSDPALQMGESSLPPAPAPKSGKTRQADEPVLLDIDLPGDEVVLGEDKPSSRAGAPSSRGGPKSGPKSGPRSPNPKSPNPKPAGDSDVRLVLEGGLDFQLEPDSDVKVPPSGGPKSPGRKSRVAPPVDSGPDSGVRIVPLDQPSDSDVRIVPADPNDESVPLGPTPKKAPSDSDIRLEGVDTGKKGKDKGVITEEIDLDAEERKLSESGTKPKPKFGTKSSPALPTTSPFELSEHDLALESTPAKGKDSGKTKGKKDPKTADETDSSSDFELMPFDSSKSPLELGSDELPQLDEEVSLGELTGPGGGGTSGINLEGPVDSGISLEDGGSDEIEFDLSLDVSGSGSGSKPAGTTPKPGPKSGTKSSPKLGAESGGVDSSSEFELTLDDDDAKGGEDSDTDSGSSEFELTLDPDESGKEVSLNLEKDSDTEAGSSEFELTLDADSDTGSDSEFELTLDAEGELGAADEGGKDIFEETNFDVPALDEESGSEAVALDEADTDTEGSDFELSLDEAGEGSSGSQVVALGEDADDAADTIAKPRPTKAKTKPKTKTKPPPASEDELDLDLDREREPAREEEEDEEPVPAAAAAAAPPAEWGVLPALLLFPTVIVMFVVGIMGFELLQSGWGYKQPTMVGKPVVKTFASMFADEKDKKLFDE